MRIDHIALWTTDLPRCQRFYVDYFGATAGSGYVNPAKDALNYGPAERSQAA